MTAGAVVLSGCFRGSVYHPWADGGGSTGLQLNWDYRHHVIIPGA